MIRYDLVCDKGHEFDGWFASSDGFDTQARRGFVLCPHCQSKKVGRAIMAPRLARTDRGEKAAPAADAPAPADAPQPVAMISEKERELRAMLKAFREHVVASTDDVGTKFPEKARRMHYGEEEHRPIRGVASIHEAIEMREEGIEVHPLPVPPEEAN